ncbi:MAG: dephospho-CoA kinase [Pseudonocardia sp.]|jgi:cation transport regulator ChaC
MGRHVGKLDTDHELFVFGYASLVCPESVGSTLGRQIDPRGFAFAELKGWRREWTVGSDRTSHPERTFIRPDGCEYEGVVAVLGISRIDGESCDGAAFPVSRGDLAVLDARERNYTRIEVTDVIAWAGKPRNCVVYTYVPSLDAVDRIGLALQKGRPVHVRLGYLQLVRAAFSRVGYDAHKPEFVRPPYPVQELRVERSRAQRRTPEG